MLTESQIKWMKENRVPFSLLTEEEKEIFLRYRGLDKVENMILWTVNRWDKADMHLYRADYVYRLRPDYEPEPTKPQIPEKLQPDGLASHELCDEENAINALIDVVTFRSQEIDSILKRLMAIEEWKA